MLAFTIALLPGLGGEFMPELEEGNLWIRALMPRTVSREEAARMAPRLREVIASVPEVRGVMSQVGRPDDGTDVTSFFNLEFNVPLRPMEEWREGMTRRKIEEKLTHKFNDFRRLEFQLLAAHPRQHRRGPFGHQGCKLCQAHWHRFEHARRNSTASRQNPPWCARHRERRRLSHRWATQSRDPDRSPGVRRYGVNVADVEEVIQVAIGGRAFSEMVEGEKRYDIVLRLPKDLRDDPGDIGRIPVDVKDREGTPGARIPLSHLAKIIPHKAGASYIYRENNRRFIPIKFSVKGRDLASTIAEARRKVLDPKTGAMLPPAYRIEWSGEFAQMQAANKLLAIMVPLSIVLIIVLLYSMFQSMKDALARHGRRIARGDGRGLGFGIYAHKLQHLRGCGIHLDLRRRSTEWCAPDLVLQSDARLGRNRERGSDPRCGTQTASGRDDLADRDPRLAAGRARDVDRLPGAEAFGNRRRWWHLDGRSAYPLPDPSPL